jgi:acyl carrier protein
MSDNAQAVLSKVRVLMQPALKLDARDSAAITMETTPATISGWTSMAHLELILAIEREFGVTFEAEEIGQLASVSAIVAVLSRPRTKP